MINEPNKIIKEGEALIKIGEKFKLKRTIEVLKKIRDVDNILNQEYIDTTGDTSPRDARWEAAIEEMNEEIELLTKEQNQT